MNLIDLMGPQIIEDLEARLAETEAELESQSNTITQYQKLLQKILDYPYIPQNLAKMIREESSNLP